MAALFCKPWRAVTADLLAPVVGVLTDIDDTLTTRGEITPDALAALGDLRAGGFPVVAVTGRSLGWSLPFASSWPVDAIVAENGAVAIVPDGAAPAVEFAQPEAERAFNTHRLKATAERILREVPGAQFAADSAGRVTDIAVDHAEFARLAPAGIDRVVDLMRDAGMNASVSSIHVNGWFGDHTKLTGAVGIVRRLWKRELQREAARWVYVGDSTNDQQMFGAFPLSVGVANLLRFAGELRVWPGYMTDGERGAGFAEVARRLLDRR